MLTTSEAAHRLGVSKTTVHRYIGAGLFPVDRDGPAVLIAADELDAFRERERNVMAQTYGTDTVARMLHCARRSVQRMVATGELDAVPWIGRALRVTRVSVVRYRNRTQAPTQRGAVVRHG